MKLPRDEDAFWGILVLVGPLSCGIAASVGDPRALCAVTAQFIALVGVVFLYIAGRKP